MYRATSRQVIRPLPPYVTVGIGKSARSKSVGFDMHDSRKVRFGATDGIERADLPLANEIWLDDLYKSCWAPKEAMKLGCHLVRYMVKPDAAMLSFSQFETVCQLTPEEARKTMQIMKVFGVLQDYVCERSDIRVTLHLSLMQRLRVLEAKQRFLAALSSGMDIPWAPPAGFPALDAAA